MKKTAQILLLLFMFFLIAPAVVSVIKKEANVDSICDFSEEEQLHKEYKLVFNYQPIFSWITPPPTLVTPILSKKTLKFDEIALGIFIPPPKIFIVL